MKELTKAEEQVMQILWRLKKAFVKEIVADFSDPKPAYNTISTIVRILERKAFVDHIAFGKTYQYFPKISKETYSKYSAKLLVDNYFSGSFNNLVSFFVNDSGITLKDADEIIKLIKSKQK